MQNNDLPYNQATAIAWQQKSCQAIAVAVLFHADRFMHLGKAVIYHVNAMVGANDFKKKDPVIAAWGDGVAAF
jgi:hypothetical protein